MTTSPNLVLPYLAANQAQKHVTVNEALRNLDAVIQISVQSTALATPPGSPFNGQRWIVAASPSGAWVGQATKIAAWQDGAWAFYAPLDGWQAWDVATRRLLYWDALTGTWSVLTSTVFSDAAFTWQDNGDATKQARVELAGLTPGAMRTLSIPDASGTLVLEGFAATLTNKTISFASNTFSGYLPAANLPALTGDVTTPGGSAATTIAMNAVSNAKAAQMVNGTIKGRKSAGLGNPEDLSGGDATSLLDVLTSSLKGLAPGPGGGTTNYLRADGTWAAPPATSSLAWAAISGTPTTRAGYGITDALSNAANAVAIANLAQMASGTIKGRKSAGLGDPEDLSAGDATSLLNVFTSSLKGLAPGSGGGTTNYLRADGTWAAPSGTSTIFPDTGFTIQNITTPSKQIAFDASLIAPATTRTLKAPDKSGTLALVETSLGQGILQARLQGLGAF